MVHPNAKHCVLPAVDGIKQVKQVHETFFDGVFFQTTKANIKKWIGLNNLS